MWGQGAPGGAGETNTHSPQDSPWGAAQGGLPSWGRISCQGPKGLMGKGPACAKFGLSLHPQAKGSWTKAGGWAPWPPGHCPESLHMASPRGLFLFQPCSQCPSLHFLLPLCVMVISPRAISRPVYPQKERKKIKKPTALSWLNNEEQKAPQLSGTKGHSLHCRVSQSRGLAKPQPWEPGLRSPQGPHGPGSLEVPRTWQAASGKHRAMEASSSLGWCWGGSDPCTTHPSTGEQ